MTTFIRFVSMLCVLTLFSVCTAHAQDQVVSLDETWNFALDPLEKGEEYKWNTVPNDWDGKSWLDVKGWDKVTVPHDQLTDPRYEWTGVAWYRKSINTPDGGDGAVYRLQFDRIGGKCEVWVNGKPAGKHLGDHTPFELDISEHVRPGKYNHVAVKVDNRWGPGDIPGPRLNGAPAAQLYPWWNYGGLLRLARLVVSPAVYITNQKIDTRPELPRGDADVTVTVFVRNASSRTVTASVSGSIQPVSSASSTFTGEVAAHRVKIPAGAVGEAKLKVTVPAGAVSLWSPDTPQLYTSRVTVESASNDGKSHSREDTFGIRSIEIKNGVLLLNGETIRMAGANRAEGHPVHGGLEPEELIELDMGLMKRAGLELHRLQHYPLSKAMLDWADRHGMLIICEVPSWGLGPGELSDKRYRDNFRGQLTEMIESSWNHPSVIGWSVGNEYQSWKPEGVDWTRTFVAQAKRLDPTRPTTFAALGYATGQKVPSNEARSMHWVDFISINYYMSGEGAGKNLDQLHKRWPDKPILISEYGKRADQASEEQRIKHFRETLEAVRQRDYVMGLAYWSFNDYRSRYPGTNVNGYRPWGIVDPDRKPRALYDAMQEDLSPAFLEVTRDQPLQVKVTSRSDFPVMTLRGYRVQAIDDAGEVVAEVQMPTLSPGESAEVTLDAPKGATVRLMRPTGFISAIAE